MKTILYNKQGKEIYNETGTGFILEDSETTGKELLLAFDQATNYTGISIFDHKKQEVIYAGVIERDTEPNPTVYKINFKRLLLDMVTKNDVKIIMHEGNHFQGLLDAYATLAVMKAAFEELKYEHEVEFANIEIFPAISGKWKKFIGATQTKENTGIHKKEIIKRKVLEHYPEMLDMREDAYDATGIGLAYYSDDNQEDVHSTLKAVKINKRYKQTVYAEYMTEEEYFKGEYLDGCPDIAKRKAVYGAYEFEFNEKERLDMNLRYQTNESNAVYYCIVPEHRMIANIWHEFGIYVSPGKVLVVYGMRMNEGKFINQ